MTKGKTYDTIKSAGHNRPYALPQISGRGENEMKKKLKYRGYKPEDTPQWVNNLNNLPIIADSWDNKPKAKEIYIKTEKLEVKITL